ncbi:hypothetical protein [Catellatospora sichuanensis]|uniref:hypothetical protein n=1 Tax=Catellatospora sichuanensis TaxID=1969805 RepID=UPI0011832E69|nr:hypothetical protein [Catellatospora sichuanensis]
MADSPSVIAKIVGALGILAQIVLLPFYLSSGLVAPLWGLILLMVIWTGLLVVAIRLWRTRPFLVPLVPVAALAVWFAVLSAGEAWLGWTP